MLQIIVALLLMQSVNSFDTQHKETFSKVDKAVKVIKLMSGFNGR